MTSSRFTAVGALDGLSASREQSPSGSTGSLKGYYPFHQSDERNATCVLKVMFVQIWIHCGLLKRTVAISQLKHRYIYLRSIKSCSFVRNDCLFVPGWSGLNVGLAARFSCRLISLFPSQPLFNRRPRATVQRRRAPVAAGLLHPSARRRRVVAALRGPRRVPRPPPQPRLFPQPAVQPRVLPRPAV